MLSLISSQPYTCFSNSLLAVSPYCTFGYQRIYSLTISLNCTSSLFIQILGLRCRFFSHPTANVYTPLPALHLYSSRSFACDVIYTHPAANVHTSLHFLKLHFISIPNSWPKFPHGRTGSHVNRPDVPLSHLNPDNFLILSSVRLYCKSRSLYLLFSRFTLLYQTFCLGYSHFVSLYCIFSHVPAA